MYHYYLSLGSNIANEYTHITQTIGWLKKIKSTKLKLSNYYITEPQNLANQRDFLNVCVYMDSDLNPFRFLAEIKKIECIIGRKPTFRYGPRVIDIDIPLKELVTSDSELLELIRIHEDSVKDQKIELVTEYTLKRR